MDELNTFESVFRKRFRDYLKSLNKSKNKRVLEEVFHTLKLVNLEMYLFGGFPKDIYLNGSKAIPRDIDIVIVENDLNSLLKKFEGYSIIKSKFGGYKIKYKGLDIDIWSLKKTWAFENKKITYKDINSLNETTFLDIESIAIELFPKKGKRKIISEGFEKAIKNKYIELNLEENPYPELNIARTLHIAKTFNHKLGPRLRQFIKLRNFDPEDVLLIYEKKYGLSTSEKEYYKNFINEIKRNGKLDNLSGISNLYNMKQTKIFE